MGITDRNGPRCRRSPRVFGLGLRLQFSLLTYDNLPSRRQQRDILFLRMPLSTPLIGSAV